jgi:hypothetical protein
LSKNQETTFPSKKPKENILISKRVPDSINSLRPKNDGKEAFDHGK